MRNDDFDYPDDRDELDDGLPRLAGTAERPEEPAGDIVGTPRLGEWNRLQRSFRSAETARRFVEHAFKNGARSFTLARNNGSWCVSYRTLLFDPCEIFRSGERWTRRELQYLIERYYGDWTPLALCAYRMRRPFSGVRSRLVRRGWLIDAAFDDSVQWILHELGDSRPIMHYEDEPEIDVQTPYWCFQRMSDLSSPSFDDCWLRGQVKALLGNDTNLQYYFRSNNVNLDELHQDNARARSIFIRKVGDVFGLRHALELSRILCRPTLEFILSRQLNLFDRASGVLLNTDPSTLDPTVARFIHSYRNLSIFRRLKRLDDYFEKWFSRVSTYEELWPSHQPRATGAFPEPLVELLRMPALDRAGPWSAMVATLRAFANGDGSTIRQYAERGDPFAAWIVVHDHTYFVREREELDIAARMRGFCNGFKPTRDTVYGPLADCLQLDEDKAHVFDAKVRSEE